ncbi:MAG: hypothetical protein P8Q41_08510 [Saprospiraceae bacterium]|nr:hypothetical protein [Saprospiraceae bacterium]
MGYRNKFEESDHKALNSIVATKILDLMAKLRNEENDNSQRRWIWELLQNAKDVVIDGQKIDIEIELEEKPESKSISFSHNGKPFSVDNITYLINQVSTKERNKKPENGENKTTGKFGTGFITTHLLSEKVEVRGIAKEPDEEYRPFLLPLDRSGRSEDEIIKSVSESIAIRDALDNQEANIDYNPVALNTSFLYNLDEEGYEVAEIGLKDLQGSLPYTLAFVPIINSVHVKHQNCNYSLSGYEKQTDEIELFSILRKTSEETKEIKIVKLTKGKTSIAIEIENKEGRTFVKPITSLLPKIFCDFPLIGTNNFPFPVIINSSYFNPTEPRDGIWLQEKNTDESQENKSLILDGLELYFQLLSYAIENKWGNLLL